MSSYAEAVAEITRRKEKAVAETDMIELKSQYIDLADILETYVNELNAVRLRSQQLLTINLN